MKYEKVVDGEWVQPVMVGYRMKCCDCGLVHIIDFKILEDEKGKFLKFRARRLINTKNR